MIDSAGERDQTAGEQSGREALAEDEAGEDRDQDRPDVDQHGGGAGVDPRLGGIQRDVVEPEPEDATNRDAW